MHPDIVSCGPLAVRGYGLMLALGFLFGTLYAAYRGKRAGIDPDHFYNLSIWLVISALLGARVYYVVTHYSEFAAPFAGSLAARVFIETKAMLWPVGETGAIGINGLVFLGGLFAATAVAALYLRRHHLPVLRTMDVMAPALGLGIFFTRIGCFLNGCCFGHPTESWVGVVFPPDSVAGSYYPQMAIHPTQLYESFGGLIILGLILFLERYKTYDGFSALLFFLFYAILRFIVDLFRYYEPELTWFGLSHNQYFCILMAALVLGAMAMLARRASVRRAAGGN